MRIRVYLHTIAVLLLLSAASAAAAPLTLANVETLLRGKVSSRRIAQLVDEKKAAFTLTSAEAKRLERLGAQGDLIAAVRRSGTASLEIASEPPGAEVFLDGRYKGTTPLVIDRVPPGRHNLQAGRLEGYHDHAEELHLMPGRPAARRIVLEPDPPRVAAARSPEAGAKIREDGLTPQKPPQETAGPRLLPARERHRREEEPQLLPVSVGTEPVSAQIYLDGKYIAGTPADFLAEVGRHHLRLVPMLNAEYETLEKEISVGQGELNVHFLRLNSKRQQ